MTNVTVEDRSWNAFSLVKIEFGNDERKKTVTRQGWIWREVQTCGELCVTIGIWKLFHSFCRPMWGARSKTENPRHEGWNWDKAIHPSAATGVSEKAPSQLQKVSTVRCMFRWLFFCLGIIFPLSSWEVDEPVARLLREVRPFWFFRSL